LLGLALLASPVFPEAGANPVQAVDSALMPESAVPAPGLTPPALPAGAAVAIVLPTLSAREAAWAMHPASISGAFRIGFGRAIAEHQAREILGNEKNWHATPGGGHAAAIRLSSPRAQGLRVGLRVLKLPDEATLRFFTPGAALVPGISGSEVNASVRGNVADGAADAVAETYWSPLIRGEAITLEIEIGAEVNPQQVRITLPRLSHLFRWPFGGTTDTAGCQEDVTCQPDWDRQSRATAMLLYTDNIGGTGACTGTLLNDADPLTSIPYVLTAHHCVSDQTRASSIEAYWFHRSRHCGGPAGTARSVTGGADLLYSAKATNTSLLRLRNPPPAGAVFSGWSATLPKPGTPLTGVHHPRGERQAIAFGSLTECQNCAEVVYCGAGPDPEAIHYLRVNWDKGVVDVGSSGSGLFLPTGQLVGTLSGGFGDCEKQQGPDDYGRFDLAYRAALHNWLERR